MSASFASDRLELESAKRAFKLVPLHDQVALEVAGARLRRALEQEFRNINARFTRITYYAKRRELRQRRRIGGAA